MSLSKMIYHSEILQKIILLLVISLFWCSTLVALETITGFEVKSEDFITLKWSALAGVAGYYIYRSTAPLLRWVIINNRPVRKNKYTDRAAKENVKYYYFVEAVDSSGMVIAKSDYSTGCLRPYISGLMLMSTAYQQKKGAYGLNLDFAFSYYIGRIYGRHFFGGSLVEPKISPIRLWFITCDIKSVLWDERKQPFSFATGFRYTYLFTDAPAPAQAAGATYAFTLSRGRNVNSVYAVIGKRFLNQGFHLGFLRGTESEVVPYLSDYIYSYYTAGKWHPTENIYFVGLDTKIIPGVRINIESLIPANDPLSFWLLHTNFAQILKLSFQIAYLQYREGYDILGYVSFRFTVLPK